MRKFKRTNINENVKPKIWFDVTIVKKDDLAYAIDNDDDVVCATKAIVCAKNEDDAIYRALELSTGHGSFYWEDHYILHSITYIGKHNHPEKEYDTYVDIPIEDVNYNSEDINYYQERENDIYYNYNESFKAYSKTHKNRMNETSFSSPRERYTSDGSLAFYKNSDKKDIIEMSEFAFAIARTVIKNCKHSREYVELLEDIVSDFTFSKAMHGAVLPDLSDTDKLEKDMGLMQGAVSHIIDNCK